MPLINRILLISLLLPLGGCALHGGPPPALPDRQPPEPTSAGATTVPYDFGADLRLSEFQGAQRQQTVDPARAPGPAPESDELDVEQAFQVSADPRALSGADSGIQPRVYDAVPDNGARAVGARTLWPSASAEPANSSVGRASGSGLGPGDLIRVGVFGQPELETSTVVSDGGRITLPLVGAIDVSGLEPQQAEERIAQAYRNGGFLIDPQITLTVQELRSRQISVLGQVQQPGRFPLSSRMTLLDALALAGGVSKTGGSEVYLIRDVAGETRKFEINIDNMLAAPDTRTLLELGAGDTVYVPEAPLFYIYGEVRRPDGYPLKPGMTVMQAISVGGGLTDRGSDSRLRIRRNDSDGGTVTLRPALEDEVRQGDVIYVKERLF